MYTLSVSKLFRKSSDKIESIMIAQDSLELMLNRVHDWIKAADQKVSIFLAFQGVILTILFSNFSSWEFTNLLTLSYLEFVLLMLSVILFVFSISKSISAIIPRLNMNRLKKSLTYFGDIAQMDNNKYSVMLKTASNNIYRSDLIDQIHISSKICTYKHKEFSNAIITFILGIILLLVDWIVIKT